MAEDRRRAIRSAIDAIPGAPGTMPAETCIEIALMAEGFHVVPGGELPVSRWNEDKRHRCPRCHAVTIDTGPPRPWVVYSCCRCGTRFARWPRLGWLLPDARAYCSECEADSRGDFAPRPRTPDVRNPGGPTTVTVQRECNGCADPLGDANEEEIEAAVDGRPLPDVRAECPQCRPSMNPKPTGGT